MNRRLVARVEFVLLILCLVLGAGGRSARLMAQSTEEAEFILRASPERVDAIAQRHGLTIVRRLGDRNIFLVRGSVDSSATTPPLRARTRNRGPRDDDDRSRRLMNRARADREIEEFHVNGQALITETVETPDLNQTTVGILDTVTGVVATYYGTIVWEPYISQAALNVIKLTDALQVATGAGVTVAIIDTGVDENHPALQGVLVPGYDFTRDLEGPGSEWPDLDQTTVGILDQNPPVPIDLSTMPPAFGHGTMVAGLVHVVAPGAKIMPLKAFNANGQASVFDLAEAIIYAVDHGAKVINMSFSMESGIAVTDAIDYASAHGVITLASVGNSGLSATVYPAAFRNVIGVGSTTVTDARAPFSNYGDHLVKIAAPGDSLITLYPALRYANVSGTSFSSGLVSGGAALLAQVVPALDYRLAGRYLDDGALKNPEWQLGDGRINLRATLESRGPIPDPPPPPPPSDTTPPAVALAGLTAGATVTGVLPIAATASDDVGVVGVQFTFDGATLGAEQTTVPYQVQWDSTGVANGTHELGAVARDAAGNVQTATTISVTVVNDTTRPTLAVTDPLSGATVNGLVTLDATATDDVGVVGVQFTLDGVGLGAEDLTSPYTFSLNSTTLSNGTHTIGATARDAAGNIQAAAPISITVNNDLSAPVIALLNPDAGALVTGSLTINATASDNVGVVGVQFVVDGTNLGSEQPAAPYTLTWNSASLGNGTHTIGAIARDAAGNVQAATPVTITVDNDLTAPTVAVLNPAVGATINGSLALTADASDNVGVAGVQFTIDGVNLGGEDLTAPYSVTWNSVTLGNGPHTIGAIARDAAGNAATATAITVTVDNDTAAPTVALVNPAAGATVTGSFALDANASDNVGVVAVQFTVDGANAGAEDVVAPYTATWNSLTVANGTHTIGAIARDAAGNVQTATSVTITVDNDLTAPTVALLNPAPGATLTGSLMLSATASDNVGVAGVQFTLDGVNLGTERTSAPYDLPWNSLTVANGVHTISAIARDAAGNVQTATSVTITVDNDLTAPTVALLNPAPDATLVGSLTLTASASDNVGVMGVQFVIDGVNLGTEVTAGPYEVVWNSGTVTDGPHVVTVVARDAAGHQQAASVNVIVANTP